MFNFRSDSILGDPIWRMQNGQGPSWRYAQAKIHSEERFQVNKIDFFDDKWPIGFPFLIWNHTSYNYYEKENHNL